MLTHGSLDRRSQCIHITDWHQFSQRSSLQDFTRTVWAISGHDLALARKRLYENVAETFESRWHHEHIGIPHRTEWIGRVATQMDAIL